MYVLLCIILLTSLDKLFQIPKKSLFIHTNSDADIANNIDVNNMIQSRTYIGISVLTHCFQSNSLRSLNIAMSNKLCSSIFKNLDPGSSPENSNSLSASVARKLLSQINELAVSVLDVRLSLPSTSSSKVSIIKNEKGTNIEKNVEQSVNEEDDLWSPITMIEKSDLCDRVRFVTLCALSQVGLTESKNNIYETVLKVWKKIKR